MPGTRELTAKVENNRFSFTFPVHSTIILHLRVE
jgi:hypothetical protein